MDEFIKNTLSTLGTQVPKVAGALAILLIGYIVASLVRSAVASLLKKTSIDNKLSKFVSSDADSPLKVEDLLASVIFWVMMLLVGVATLDALGLTAVAAPLNELSGQVLAYVPRILGAFLLLVVAWVLATGCRNLVTTGLSKTKLDTSLGGEVAEGDVPMSKTLGDVCYWLIFLFFLPGLLSVLEVEGLLQPVRLMMDRFLEFLPNLFGAAVIFGIGWLCAKIVQNIVTGVTAAAGIDKGAEKVGVAQALGKNKISKALGTVVFAFILLPTVVAALDALKMHAVTEPIKGLLQTFIDFVPAMFGAFVVLAVAHVVAKWLQPIIESVLSSIGTDKVPELLGVGSAEKKVQLSSLVSRFFYIAVMVLAALEGSRMIGLESLTVVISELGVAVTQVLLGCIIFGFGLYLARLASETIVGSGVAQASLVAKFAKAAILFLAGAMALRRMGLADDIIQTAFSLLLGAVAVAIALAFGLGGRDVAGKQLASWVEDLKN